MTTRSGNLPFPARLPARAKAVRTGLTGLVVAAPMSPAFAAELDTFDQVNQREFRLISEDLGSTFSYKGLVPAETTGVSGFDISGAVTGTRLQSESLISKAAGGASVSSTIPVPSLRIHKGLPFGLSIGGMLAQSSATDLRLVGGELRWAFVPGDVILPAVALRGAMTKVTGVDQLDFETRSVDLSISKGFLMLTPYAGIGRVQVTSTPKGVPGLVEEKFWQTRTFIGLNVNLGINLAFEADRTGDATSYGIKAGIRF